MLLTVLVSVCYGSVDSRLAGKLKCCLVGKRLGNSEDVFLFRESVVLLRLLLVKAMEKKIQ